MILIFREQQAVKVPTPTETTENSKCFNNSENKNLLNKESKDLSKSIDDEISSRTLPILALNEVNNSSTFKVIRGEKNNFISKVCCPLIAIDYWFESISGIYWRIAII